MFAFTFNIISLTFFFKNLISNAKLKSSIIDKNKEPDKFYQNPWTGILNFRNAGSVDGTCGFSGRKITYTALASSNNKGWFTKGKKIFSRNIRSKPLENE